MTWDFKLLLPMTLSFFGGGGGGGFRRRSRDRDESDRGGRHNSRELGRRQHGNTPMPNDRQNPQVDAAARSLGVRLTRAQRREVHDIISRTGGGFDAIRDAIREVLRMN
ncbi:MAG: hypothetical protein FWE29_04965 [Defluviitaleaceae bacterium]|nr:hypothetical protein [Defluviitaleaceae bacterium]